MTLFDFTEYYPNEQEHRNSFKLERDKSVLIAMDVDIQKITGLRTD